MRCGLACVIVAASAGTSSADPWFELDLGLAVEHVSGGECSNGAYPFHCDSRWAEGLQLDAGQTWQIGLGSSAVARELASVADANGGNLGASMLVHGYLGAGARWTLSQRFYTELTLGVDLQQAMNTGAGEAGVATSSHLAFAPRAGVRSGRWAVAIEAIVIPNGGGTVGLAEYHLALLASRAFGS